MRKVVVTCFAAAVVSVFSTVSGSLRADVAQPPEVVVTIDAPVDGARTSARSIVVRGKAPVAPVGGDAWVEVTVGRRQTEAVVEGGRYRADVVLELGRNRISARAWVTDRDGNDSRVISAPAADVTRRSVPGDGTGTLDRATAFFVAGYTEEVYWVCGESDDCEVEPVCVRVGSRRVDCPAATWSSADPVRRCGVVISVLLRNRRVFTESYRCRGRIDSSPRRFVRRALDSSGERFRVGAGAREEITEPNRYGLPRFDVDRDVFLP